jgi:hypothetical protein
MSQPKSTGERLERLEAFARAATQAIDELFSRGVDSRGGDDLPDLPDLGEARAADIHAVAELADPMADAAPIDAADTLDLTLGGGE